MQVQSSEMSPGKKLPEIFITVGSDAVFTGSETACGIIAYTPVEPTGRGTVAEYYSEKGLSLF